MVTRASGRSMALLVLAVLLLPGALAVMGQDSSRGPTRNQDSEPNDTLVDATLVDLDLTTIPGTLSMNDMDDIYRIDLRVNDTLMETDRLIVAVDFQNIGAEPSATILDPWGFVLEHRTGGSVVLEVTASEDLQGFYYIHLRAGQGGTQYSMDVEVRSETLTSQDMDNNPNTATVLPGSNPDTVEDQLVGGALNSDLHDFYKVHVDSDGYDRPGLLSLHLDVSDQGQYKLEVYDRYFTLLDEERDLSEPKLGQDTALSYLMEEDADLYVRVWAVNGTGAYTLTAYVLLIDNLEDGILSSANDIEFLDTNLHLANMEDGVGFNSYPGISDEADVWRVPVVAGQYLRGTVTSLYYDIALDMPKMKLVVYDHSGREYTFDGAGESYDGFVDAKGGFELNADHDGFVYIEVGLQGAGSGGGTYTLDLFTDRPPHVTGKHDMDVTVPDLPGQVLVDLNDLFADPEGDILVHDIEVEDDVFRDSVPVMITDMEMVELSPTPRFSGRSNVTIRALERDYGLDTEFTFNVTVEPCGCYKVRVKEPFDTTGEYSVPIELIYLDQEEVIIDLADVFYDPLGSVLEYGIVGDGLLPKVVQGALGQYIDMAVLQGAVVIDLPYPVHSGLGAPLRFAVLDAAHDKGATFETTVRITAWPMDDLKVEASKAIEFKVVLSYGHGHAPELDLPDHVEMEEDTKLELELAGFVSDVDGPDQGRLQFSMTIDGFDVTAQKVSLSSFMLVPRKDWCGQTTMKVRVSDTFGWTSMGDLELSVLCIHDGPELVVASPPTDDIYDIFEGEEMAFTVIMRDPDTEGEDLVLDWYVNGHPNQAGGGQTYLFAPGLGSSGTHTIMVEVTNRETGMKAVVEWKVTVHHINLAPTGQIEVLDRSNRTHVQAEVGEGLVFICHGVDPERAPLDLTWDFGDGTTDRGRSVSHSFDRPGRYVVTVMVSDGELSTYAHIDVTVKGSSLIVAAQQAIDIEVGLWFALIVLVMTAVGAGSTEPGRFRIFLFLTVLYSKLRKTKILDHYIRGRIQGYITANPGSHYNMIKADLQINNGNLAYHLQVLERQGYIRSVRDGIYKRFYPDTMSVPRPPSLQERILVLLRTHPGLTQKEIAIKLDEKPSTINDYVRRMVAASLLRVERAGVKNHCYVMDGPMGPSDGLGRPRA